MLPVPLFLAASSGGTALRYSVTNFVCILKDTQPAEGHKLIIAGRFAKGQVKLRAGIEAPGQRDSADSVTQACLMDMIGYAEIQQLRPDLAIRLVSERAQTRPAASSSQPS